MCRKNPYSHNKLRWLVIFTHDSDRPVVFTVNHYCNFFLFSFWIYSILVYYVRLIILTIYIYEFCIQELTLPLKNTIHQISAITIIKTSTILVVDKSLVSCNLISICLFILFYKKNYHSNFCDGRIIKNKK